MDASSLTAARGDRPFWIVNGVVSVVALAVLAYLLLLRHGSGDPARLAFMPAVNAGFNALAAVLLVLAVRAIKRKHVARHQALMLAAFASSSFFLVGYLAYHYVHGDSKYPGGGGARAAYLVLLASHVILSIPIVPMCLGAFYFAFRRRFAAHTRITKILYPIWLYVSVTGVLVFFMLRSGHAEPRQAMASVISAPAGAEATGLPPPVPRFAPAPVPGAEPGAAAELGADEPLPADARLLAAFGGKRPRGFVAVTNGHARKIVSLGGNIEDDRPVAIASFTKLWTAVAVLRLVERGVIGLDDPLRVHVPALASRRWADATVRELLTHTSPVPELEDGFYGRPGVDFGDPIRVLSKAIPGDVVEKRGVYKYRNAEFALLGALLQERSGMPAADVLGREVFGPAKMTRSGLWVAAPPLDLDRPSLGGIRPANFFTAGAGWSTAHDLLAFYEALANDALLTSASKERLFDGAASRSWGAFGCWVYPVPNDGGRSSLVERSGSFGNVRLTSIFYPESGRAVVAWAGEPIDFGRPRQNGIARALADAIRTSR
jgi:putative membrane protein